jgi:hypothetical protein
MKLFIVCVISASLVVQRTPTSQLLAQNGGQAAPPLAARCYAVLARNDEGVSLNYLIRVCVKQSSAKGALLKGILNVTYPGGGYQLSRTGTLNCFIQIPSKTGGVPETHYVTLSLYGIVYETKVEGAPDTEAFSQLLDNDSRPYGFTVYEGMKNCSSRVGSTDWIFDDKATSVFGNLPYGPK